MQYDQPMHHHSKDIAPANLDSSIVWVDPPKRFEGPGHREAVLLGAQVVGRLIESERDARTDYLTGLPNKRAFDEGLSRIIGNEQESDNPKIALVYFDLDNFKRVNDDEDKGGHEAGDRVLGVIGQILKERLSLREDEILARIGGDEFAAIIRTENLGNDNRRANLSEDEILNGFRKRIVRDVDRLANEIGMDWLGVSIGFAKYIKGESTAELKNRADRAMYLAKEERKNSKK